MLFCSQQTGLEPATGTLTTFALQSSESLCRNRTHSTFTGKICDSIVLQTSIHHPLMP